MKNHFLNKKKIQIKFEKVNLKQQIKKLLIKIRIYSNGVHNKV